MKDGTTASPRGFLESEFRQIIGRMRAGERIRRFPPCGMVTAFGDPRQAGESLDHAINDAVTAGLLSPDGEAYVRTEAEDLLPWRLMLEGIDGQIEALRARRAEVISLLALKERRHHAGSDS